MPQSLHKSGRTVPVNASCSAFERGTGAAGQTCVPHTRLDDEKSFWQIFRVASALSAVKSIIVGSCSPVIRRIVIVGQVRVDRSGQEFSERCRNQEAGMLHSGIVCGCSLKIRKPEPEAYFVAGVAIGERDP